MFSVTEAYTLQEQTCHDYGNLCGYTFMSASVYDQCNMSCQFYNYHHIPSQEIVPAPGETLVCTKWVTRYLQLPGTCRGGDCDVY